MNPTRFLSFFKPALAAVIVITLALISGCSTSDGPKIYNGTIMDLIKDTQFQQATNGNADESLDSLAKYLAKYPDLVTTLSGTGPYTFYAPSNTAFVSLLATPGFPSNIIDISPDLIKGVLAYHITSGKTLKAGLTATGTGAGISTLFSKTNPCTAAQTVEVIKVNDNGTLLTGSSNAAIEIQKADNLANNGVVHVTKSVLIPPSVGEGITPNLGKLSGTILLAANFTTLAKAMTKADCGVPGVVPISVMLQGAGPYTTFLPPNAVFEGTAAAKSITVDQLIAAYTAEQWRKIILNHIVSGTKNKATLTAGTQLTTLLDLGKLTVSDAAISASTPTGKVLTTSGTATGLGGPTNSPILVADVAASNGVAHVVGKILIPN
jgi:uncharacterized surface protein with fasciclin (FAS1) repeats